MPLFEYQCSNCHQVFEYLRLSRADTGVECPHCGGTEAKQQLSVFAARTGGRNASNDCYNAAAGICQAGGGTMV